MGICLPKEKILTLNPVQILPTIAQTRDRNLVELTVKPEPGKIIIALLAFGPRKPVAYIYIDTKTKLNKDVVLDALFWFLRRSLLNVRFVKKQHLDYYHLKMIDEKDNNGEGEDVNNDDTEERKFNKDDREDIYIEDPKAIVEIDESRNNIEIEKIDKGFIQSHFNKVTYKLSPESLNFQDYFVQGQVYSLIVEAEFKILFLLI